MVQGSLLWATKNLSFIPWSKSFYLMLMIQGFLLSPFPKFYCFFPRPQGLHRVNQCVSLTTGSCRAVRMGNQTEDGILSVEESWVGSLEDHPVDQHMLLTLTWKVKTRPTLVFGVGA